MQYPLLDLRGWILDIEGFPSSPYRTAQSSLTLVSLSLYPARSRQTHLVSLSITITSPSWHEGQEASVTASVVPTAENCRLASAVATG